MESNCSEEQNISKPIEKKKLLTEKDKKEMLNKAALKDSDWLMKTDYDGSCILIPTQPFSLECDSLTIQMQLKINQKHNGIILSQRDLSKNGWEFAINNENEFLFLLNQEIYSLGRLDLKLNEYYLFELSISDGYVYLHIDEVFIGKFTRLGLTPSTLKETTTCKFCIGGCFADLYTRNDSFFDLFLGKLAYFKVYYRLLKDLSNQQREELLVEQTQEATSSSDEDIQRLQENPWQYQQWVYHQPKGAQSAIQEQYQHFFCQTKH